MISAVDAVWPEVRTALQIQGAIEVRAYGVLPVTEDFLRQVMQEILKQSGRSDLTAIAVMLLKELTVNAAKANFKSIIFKENGLDPEDPEHYERGMSLFKDAFSEAMPYIYGPKVKRENLHVLVVMSFDKNRLRIEVRNNTPMKKHEEARVREKLALAMSCEDIADFLVNHGDDTEGAGLGIFLSLSALRAAGVDPRVCVIRTDGKYGTLASFELPLDKSYQPELEKY